LSSRIFTCDSNSSILDCNLPMTVFKSSTSVEKHTVKSNEIKNSYCQTTALQVGRLWVWFPMVSLEFFIDIILPAALRFWGWLSF
jgi:hypothetical protein